MAKRRRMTRKSRVPRVGRYLTSSTLGIGFPRQCFMTHKYTIRTDVELAEADGVSTLQYFAIRASDIRNPTSVDPPITGEHQPMFYQQMQGIYNNWTVVGSKCRARFCVRQGIRQVVTGPPLVVYPDPTATAIVAGFTDDNGDLRGGIDYIDQVSEQYRAKLVRFPTVSIGDGTDREKYITLTYSQKKTGFDLLGNDVVGDIDESPDSNQYFLFCFQLDPPAITTPAVDRRVWVEGHFEVTYCVRWFELRDAEPSTAPA